MTTTKTVLENVKTEGNEVIEFNNGGQLGRTPMWNPFLFTHGRSQYVVRGFNFYNEEGIVFELKSGWFGSNNDKDSMGFVKDGKNVTIKKKKEAGFDTSEVYFVSQGKNIHGENEAIIYAPMTYLSNMGYEVIETVRDNEFDTFTEVTLKTAEFQQYLVYKSERKFDKQKEAFMKEMEKATTPAEFKEVIKKWEYKVY